MPCGLHLHCCFWEGKMTPRLPNTHVVCFFCFLISLLKTPLSPVSSGVRLLIILQDLLFIPQNLSHPSKLIMRNLVHFRYLLYAANSFLSLSLPDRSLPSYPYFNNLYKWQITFLFWTAALPLYFAVRRASFFHILPFFFFSLYLHNNVSAWKSAAFLFWWNYSSSHSDLFMLDWAHIKEIPCLSCFLGGWMAPNNLWCLPPHCS